MAWLHSEACRSIGHLCQNYGERQKRSSALGKPTLPPECVPWLCMSEGPRGRWNGQVAWSAITDLRERTTTTPMNSATIRPDAPEIARPSLSDAGS